VAEEPVKAEGRRRRRAVQRGIKWLADRLLAAVLLVLFSPLGLALALWVRLDAGRPVFFVQRRVGREGTEFAMLKFRSMVNDAVRVGIDLGISDDPHGVIRDDPRITRSGRFLRRTGLDELPQLVNVLRGQMSLVGPRPDIPEQAQHYSDHERQRLAVKPGITGLAQVTGRDEIEWPERIEHDLWYIRHWSLLLDLKILLATVAQVFRAEPEPVLDTHNIERSA
jgi:lipopolysaccharide/colanic/teichoic acid biosynthesis glycosyltransferase